MFRDNEMKNLLRIANERFSYSTFAERLFFVGALVGIPAIFNIFIDFDKRIVGICYIVFGFIFWIESYYHNKNNLKKGKHIK